MDRSVHNRTSAEIAAEFETTRDHRDKLVVSLAQAQEDRTTARASLRAGDEEAEWRVTDASNRVTALEDALDDLNDQLRDLQDDLNQARNQEAIQALIAQIRLLTEQAHTEWDRYNSAWDEGTKVVDRVIEDMVASWDRRVELQAAVNATIRSATNPDELREALKAGAVDLGVFYDDQNQKRPDGMYPQVFQNLLSAVLQCREDEKREAIRQRDREVLDRVQRAGPGRQRNA